MQRKARLQDVFNKIINESLHKMETERGNQIQDEQRTPSILKQKQSLSEHNMFKLPLVEHKILKHAHEKGQITHRNKSIRLTAYFSKETLQTQRERSDAFQILKETVSPEYQTQSSFHSCLRMK